MRPVVVTVGPLAGASANNIATAQSIAAAGPLTLNGSAVSNGVGTLDTARRVAVASSGNDSGLSFLVTGTDRQGQAQSERIAGANAGSAQSALDYATVSSVATSGATAGTVTVGTTAIASSAYVRMDEFAANQFGGNVVQAGAGTWALEGSFDDPNSTTFPVAPAAMAWFPIQDAQETGPISASSCPIFARLTILTGSPTLRATLLQYAELSRIS